MKIVLSTAIALALIASAASAVLTPEQRAAAERYVAQFGAAEFDVRQKAVDAVVALGVDVAPLVRKTLAETKDNEVRLRCEMALKGLRERFGAAALGETAPGGAADYGASKVSLDVKDAPLSEVLDDLARQSGNARLDARNFKDRPVTLTVKDAPYWPTLDRALEQARVVYMPAWYRGGAAMLLEAKSAGPALTAYAGPVVLWVDRVTRQTTTQKTVRLRTDFTGAVMPDTQRTTTVFMRAAVEDRLSASGCTVRFTKALTPDGKDVLPKTATTPSVGGSPMLMIPDTEEGIRGPLTVEGVVHVDCFVGTKERRVDDLFGGGKQTVGDEEALLADVRAERRGTTVRVSLTLREHETRPSPAAWGLPRNYGFILVDPEGKRLTTLTGSSRIGTELDLTFSNIPEIPGRWSLLYVFPERVDGRDHPFTIRDVPLP